MQSLRLLLCAALLVLLWATPAQATSTSSCTPPPGTHEALRARAEAVAREELFEDWSWRIDLCSTGIERPDALEWIDNGEGTGPWRWTRARRQRDGSWELLRFEPAPPAWLGEAIESGAIICGTSTPYPDGRARVVRATLADDDFAPLLRDALAIAALRFEVTPPPGFGGGRGSSHPSPERYLALHQRGAHWREDSVWASNSLTALGARERPLWAVDALNEGLDSLAPEWSPAPVEQAHDWFFEEWSAAHRRVTQRGAERSFVPYHEQQLMGHLATTAAALGDARSIPLLIDWLEQTPPWRGDVALRDPNPGWVGALGSLIALSGLDLRRDEEGGERAPETLPGLYREALGLGGE